MGDVNFSGYEYLDRIHTDCQEPNPIIIPGISSAQMAASKTLTAFETSVFLTFHKRGDISEDKEFLVSALKQGKSAIVIPLPFYLEIFSPYSSKNISYAKPFGLFFPSILQILLERIALSIKSFPYIS